MSKPRRIRIQPQRTASMLWGRSAVRHLIWIDMEPLLSAERTQCEKVAQKLDIAKSQLAHFREVCEPGFSRWFHSHYGERVSVLRELEDKFRRLDAIMSEVEEQVLFTGCSPRSAYLDLERERKDRERVQREMDQAFDEKMKRQAEAQEQRSRENATQEDSEFKESDLPPHIEAMMRATFETLFGDEKQLGKKQFRILFESFKKDFREEVLGHGAERDEKFHEDPFEAHRSKSHHRRSNPAREDETDDDDGGSDRSRVKQIYRQLARRLHPDHHTNLSEREKELWHEVQAAYEAHDLDRLETLLAVTDSNAEAGVSGFRSIKSVGRLRALVLDFGRKLKATQKALREAKKSPSWNFATVESDPTKLKELSRRIQRELSEAAQSLGAQVAEMEAQIAEWSKPRSGHKEKSSRDQGQSRGRRRAR